MSQARQFDQVSVVCKANVYFDGKVVSHSILFPDGTKKSAGLIYPGQYTFNTGSSAYQRGIVSKNSDLLIPFEFGKTIGPVVLNLELGRDFHAHEAAERDFWFAGLTAGHAFSSHFEGIAELYLPETSRDFRHSRVILNLGMRYKLSEDLVILASSGTGIGGAERPKFVGYYGLQWVF